ncbi:MAG: redox-regulated ATPase YchF [Bradymonadaceae bacterium]
MSLSVGLVGLPNVGKSTLFNALSSAEAESENYPFCTIDPNKGVIAVPDPRLETIEEHIDPEESIPATVEFLDIAGLVEGASEGEGLGNQFLSHVREVDALVHVVRCFDDEDITHVEGSVDPARDVEIIDTELILADLETLDSRLEKARRNAKGEDKEATERVAVLERVRATLNEGVPARAMELDAREEELLADSHLLTQKPVLYVANVDEAQLDGDSDAVRELEAIAEEEGSEVVPICATLEAELAELDERERREMLATFGIDEPALDTIIRRAYELLGLHTFFTIANDKLRAWALPIGATAPQAAGVVHSDFQEHFIRAEVFSVEDLERHGDEAAIREAGDMRVEGKDYVVHDGDVLRIRHDA